MIVLKDISSTDGLTIETETSNSFNIILDGTKITNDRTVIDKGDKILLESSIMVNFKMVKLLQVLVQVPPQLY